MSVLKAASLLIEAGNIWVGSVAGDIVDLGAVRNVKFMAEMKPTKINSDNRGTVLWKIRPQSKVSFDWLECANVDNLEILFKGILTKTTTAAVLVSGASFATAAGWAYLTLIIPTGQNADGTQMTFTSVTGSTDGLLTLNTNWFVAKDPASGRWGFYIKSGGAVTTLNQTLTLVYSYTPAASKNLAGGSNQTATDRFVRIIGPSEDSSLVTRTIDLPNCVATSELLLPFVDVESANDSGIMPVTLELNKGVNFTMTDQVNAS